MSQTTNKRELDSKIRSGALLSAGPAERAEQQQILQPQRQETLRDHKMRHAQLRDHYVPTQQPLTNMSKIKTENLIKRLTLHPNAKLLFYRLNNQAGLKNNHYVTVCTECAHFISVLMYDEERLSMLL